MPRAVTLPRATAARGASTETPGRGTALSHTQAPAALSSQCILVPHSALSLPGVQDLTCIKATQSLLLLLITAVKEKR